MMTSAVGLLALGGAVKWAVNRYKVAPPNKYLARTGIFIDDIDISKKAFQ